MNKPKRGCVGNLIRWAVIGIVVLVGLGLVAQVINPPKPTPRPEVVNTINTVQPSATAAPTDKPTVKPTLRASNTLAPTRTRRPTLTPDFTKTFAPTATITQTPKTIAFNEATYVNFIQAEIAKTNLNVQSVKVANGRPNGGSRAVIITYITSGMSEAVFFDEWEALFTRTASALKTNNLDVDEVSLIVGLVNGKTGSILVAQIKDLREFFNNTINRDEFFKRLTYTSF